MNECLNYNDCMTEAEFMYWLDISTERSALAESEAKGEARGLAQGLAQGVAQGAKQNAIATAKRMKAKNYPIEDIAELTGLSAEEIAEIFA